MMTPALAVRRAVLLYGAVALAAALIVLIVLALAGVSLLWSVLAGLVIGLCGTGLLYRRQEAMVLRSVGAEPLRPGAHPRLENVVAGLCVSNGFREPALYIIDDAAPNMLAVGRHPRHGALVTSTGLLERLGRVELEGAVAHELTRIRNRTTLLDATVGVLIVRPLGLVPTLAGSLAQRLLDPRTNVEVDAASVQVTRYPPGLASALRSLRSDGRAPKANPLAFRHLWVDPPADPIVAPDFSIDDRIEVLDQL